MNRQSWTDSFGLTDMDRYRKIWTDTDEKLWTSVEPSTSFINNPEAHGIDVDVFEMDMNGK